MRDDIVLVQIDYGGKKSTPVPQREVRGRRQDS